MAGRNGKTGQSGKRQARGAAQAKTAKPDDTGLLDKLAEGMLDSPQAEPGEMLEGMGVESLATQRRVRRRFEAEREQLMNAAKTRADRGREGSSARSAPLVATRDARMSMPAEAEARARTPEGRQERDKPAPQRHETAQPEARPTLADALAGSPLPIVQAAARAAVQLGTRATQKGEANGLALAPLALPWMKAGIEATTAAIRLQRAMLDSWLKLPPVSLALSQQTALYNMLLGAAGSLRPPGRN